MKVIQSPRGAGKTTEIVKQSAETGAVIVCISIHATIHVLRIANQLKLRIPTPFILDEIFNPISPLKSTGVKLIMDDLDIMLEIMTGCGIEAVTITKE